MSLGEDHSSSSMQCVCYTQQGANVTFTHLDLLGMDIQDLEYGFHIWEGNVDMRVEMTRPNQRLGKREEKESTIHLAKGFATLQATIGKADTGSLQLILHIITSNDESQLCENSQILLLWVLNNQSLQPKLFGSRSVTSSLCLHKHTVRCFDPEGSLSGSIAVCRHWLCTMSANLTIRPRPSKITDSLSPILGETKRNKVLEWVEFT